MDFVSENTLESHSIIIQNDFGFCFQKIFMMTSLMMKKVFWILFPEITMGDLPEILPITVKNN